MIRRAMRVQSRVHRGWTHRRFLQLLMELNIPMKLQGDSNPSAPAAKGKEVISAEKSPTRLSWADEVDKEMGSEIQNSVAIIQSGGQIAQSGGKNGISLTTSPYRFLSRFPVVER